jgi:V-type H+-transporting ATPase subunit a
MRICSSYGASIYPYPQTPAELTDQLQKIDERLRTMGTVQEHTLEQKHTRLNEIKTHLRSWGRIVAREKAVYHTLNLFSADRYAKCLVGEGWVAKRNVPFIHTKLISASAAAQSQIASIATPLRTKKTPPTFIRSTKFTEAVQTMTDAYGIANYREVNPALIAIFSFPFLFALMFGDFGHGFLLAAVGAVFCIFEKKFAKMSSDVRPFSPVILLSFFLLFPSALVALSFSLLFDRPPVLSLLSSSPPPTLSSSSTSTSAATSSSAWASWQSTSASSTTSASPSP